jgi:nucleoside-diphosphate-sugar epimerase
VAGNVYNIGNGGRTSILELLGRLNELLGTRLEPTHGPARAGDVLHSQADISRAQAELGYEPAVGLREGLRRTLESFRTRGA